MSVIRLRESVSKIYKKMEKSGKRQNEKQKKRDIEIITGH